ncbi:hypothetical protein [Plantactinospora sp. B24E8]|uniref:hypothetical protein n=1 Tax=Plantactinospora sp. B24E8 TaxID=3153567 RepID=UPI00325D7CC9
MSRLPFDPLDPPTEPPPDCVLPTLWRIAHTLHQLHQPDDDNRCACGAHHPCAHRRASLRALLEASGIRLPVPRTDLFDLWRGILLAEPADRGVPPAEGRE